MSTKPLDLSSSSHFHVFIFFPDGRYDQVQTSVPAAEAFDAFVYHTETVGAKLGTTARVIIVDMGDNINAEWIYGRGITFPTEEDIAQMRQAQQKGQ